MISERTRIISSWEEAVTILSKNCSVQAKNINELERALLNLEKSVKKKNRMVGIMFMTLGVMISLKAFENADIQKRLDKCEEQLKEKQDRVHYYGN